jgi:DNA-binding NarL/FixJ family response regulator
MANPASDSDRVLNVLLVDDHPTFRAGLRSVIEHIDNLAVCAEADGESDAMRLLQLHSPDLMIADLNLNDSSGLSLIQRARHEYPSLHILVASMYEESLYGERAIVAGANGYFCKHDDPELLVKAIELVCRGEMFISRKLANKMLEHRISGASHVSGEPADCLSDRELQIFGLIGSGLSTREIADKLHLSPKTIDTHRDHIKRKIGVDDNVRLVHRAIEWTLSQ